jgi:hypothetical protein
MHHDSFGDRPLANATSAIQPTQPLTSESEPEAQQTRRSITVAVAVAVAVAVVLCHIL